MDQSSVLKTDNQYCVPHILTLPCCAELDLPTDVTLKIVQSYENFP